MIYCCKILVIIFAEICIKMHYFYWEIVKIAQCWGLCPRLPCFWQMRASLPDSQWPPVAGSSAPRHPTETPPLWYPAFASEGRNWKFWSLIERNWKKNVEKHWPSIFLHLQLFLVFSTLFFLLVTWYNHSHSQIWQTCQLSGLLSNFSYFMYIHILQPPGSQLSLLLPGVQKSLLLRPAFDPASLVH